MENRVSVDKLTNKGTSELPIYYYKQILFSGIIYNADIDGTVYLEEAIKDGYKNGIEKRWYENGQLSAEFSYKDGKWDGLSKKWDENGQIKKVASGPPAPGLEGGSREPFCPKGCIWNQNT